MEKFLSVMLKRKVEVRMRPGFFPFVEPGFEIDARYELDVEVEDCVLT